MNKTYVLKTVTFGSKQGRSKKLIQFETLESYQLRGGLICTSKRKPSTPELRNLVGPPKSPYGPLAIAA